MTTVADWLAALDRIYPPSGAEDWDNTGLQCGDRSWTVERVLVGLDPTLEVIREGIARSAQLLVTHHPLLVRPVSRLDVAETIPRALAAALAGPLAVIACHTNADVAQPGVSDALAETLGLQDPRPLTTREAGRRVKLVTFVPPEATSKVLDALSSAGAGVIGEYDTCSFRVRGTGTFRPSQSASPTVGARGELNEVEEDRLEAVVPREGLREVLEALLNAHPYEEVAYDLYPLESTGGPGLGRIGDLAEPLAAGDLAARCERSLGARVRMIGDPERPVQRVAVCGGSGGGLIEAASRAGAEAYVTGDLDHHHALEAAALELVAIDAGHHATEWPFVRDLADRLRRDGPGADVLVAETSTDPFGEAR